LDVKHSRYFFEQLSTSLVGRNPLVELLVATGQLRRHRASTISDARSRIARLGCAFRNGSEKGLADLAPELLLSGVTVTLALVGDENTAYPSHLEINAVRTMLGDDVTTEWIPTGGERITDLTDFDGVWLAPGSPYVDDAAVYMAIRWARENDVPFLGTCSGLQYAVIEYFRNVLGAADASHAESDGIDNSNVIRMLACSLQGEERLVRPTPQTRFCRLMNAQPFIGMHYCNYGPGSVELRLLSEGGLLIEATADDAEAEVIELSENEFFMLTLFQPQIGARTGRPLHPLLVEFVRCARLHAGRRRRDSSRVD
jgi:CTP synthase (UTP-ammonia lyase)